MLNKKGCVALLPLVPPEQPQWQMMARRLTRDGIVQQSSASSQTFFCKSLPLSSFLISTLSHSSLLTLDSCPFHQHQPFFSSPNSSLSLVHCHLSIQQDPNNFSDTEVMNLNHSILKIGSDLHLLLSNTFSSTEVLRMMVEPTPLCAPSPLQ